MSPRRVTSARGSDVRIESDRRYRFDREASEVWAALTRVDQYREWWPWLRALDADCLAVGERWSCIVQPPLPYRLRFTLTLTSVTAPELVAAEIDGDITGSAQVALAPLATGCELRLTSSLAAIGSVLRLVTRRARPVAVWGHDRVLDTGVEQFRSRGLRH